MALIPVGTLYRRGRHVLRHEGRGAFIKQGLSFAGTLFFACGDYHIYEKELHPGERIECKPKIDCTEKVISSVAELEELAEQGYDFKAMNFSPKLESGAIAFCIFVGQELATVTWVAASEKAKGEVDFLPFKVDFSAREVCHGASYTSPEFRSKGLHGYNRAYMYRHLAERGVTRDRFTIGANRISAERELARVNAIKIGSGRYLKILWLRFWKEQPIEENRQ